jgi:hypothetical protein
MSRCVISKYIKPSHFMLHLPPTRLNLHQSLDGIWNIPNSAFSAVRFVTRLVFNPLTFSARHTTLNKRGTVKVILCHFIIIILQFDIKCLATLFFPSSRANSQRRKVFASIAPPQKIANVRKSTNLPIMSVVLR